MSDSEEEAFESADEESTKTEKPQENEGNKKIEPVVTGEKHSDKRISKEQPQSNISKEKAKSDESDFEPQQAMDRGKDIGSSDRKENVQKLFDKISEPVSFLCIFYLRSFAYVLFLCRKRLAGYPGKASYLLQPRRPLTHLLMLLVCI